MGYPQTGSSRSTVVPYPTENVDSSKHQQHDEEAVQRALDVARIAVENRALDVRVLNVGPQTSIAEYFVIASGTSERHVQGLSDKIRAEMKKSGEQSYSSLSGYENAEWIILDLGDVVAHIFYEPVRHYYNLDEVWKNSEEIPLGEELEEQSRKLRTGIFPLPGSHER